MAYSNADWPVISNWGDSRLTSVKYVAGARTVLAGDVGWLFNWFTQEYHENIERLDVQADEWGHNPRKIAGTNVYSRHARALALDLNSAKHPMFRDTMSAPMEAKIRDLVARAYPAIRWGGGTAYVASGRIDQMHFEINCSPAELRVVVQRLKSGGTVVPTARPTVKPTLNPKAWPYAKLRVDGDLGKITVTALQVLLRDIDAYEGKIDGDLGPMTLRALQVWLSQVGFYKGNFDGKFQSMSVTALQLFLKDRGFYPGRLDNSWGPITTKGLQGYLNAQARYFN